MRPTWTDSYGQTIVAHDEKQCAGGSCVLHNPSWHLMRDWPTYFRGDRLFLVERMCEHGVGHPDPDSARFLIESGRDETAGIHGCDGCCSPIRQGRERA